jgi:uncharacterized protein YndB with AHSA1/START domain
MKEIHTGIEINASAEKVWRVLTDFAAYPEWKPFVRRIDGDVSVAARLHVYIQPSWRERYEPGVEAACGVGSLNKLGG